MTDADDSCVHCGAPGDLDEDGYELHLSHCPYVTNVFPVTEQHLELACPCCGGHLADEEFYTTVKAPSSHPVTREYPDREIRIAVCLGCAVAGRDVPTD